MLDQSLEWETNPISSEVVTPDQQTAQWSQKWMPAYMRIVITHSSYFEGLIYDQIRNKSKQNPETFVV